MKPFPRMYVVYNEYEPDCVEFDGLYHSFERARLRCAKLNEDSEGRNPWDFHSLIVEDNKDAA